MISSSILTTEKAKSAKQHRKHYKEVAVGRVTKTWRDYENVEVVIEKSIRALEY